MSANPSDASNDSEMNDPLSNPLSQQEFEHLSQHNMEDAGSGSGDEDCPDPDPCTCCLEDE